MKNNFLVSIIIPIYNVEKYLNKCLDSVINQTYSNLEIILVDNNSSDDSLAIATEFADKDKRIKILKQSKRSVTLTRKLGVENASGDYICSIDSDDYIDSNFVELLLTKTIESNADFVQCSFDYFGINNNTCIFNEYITCINDKGYSFLEKWMAGTKEIGSQITTKLFKAEIVKNVFNKITPLIKEGDDQMYFLYYLKDAKKIVSISDVLYHYRYRNDSLSHKISFKWLINELVMINRLSNIIEKEYPLLDRNELINWKKRYRHMRINDFVNYKKV